MPNNKGLNQGIDLAPAQVTPFDQKILTSILPCHQSAIQPIKAYLDRYVNLTYLYIMTRVDLHLITKSLRKLPDFVIDKLNAWVRSKRSINMNTKYGLKELEAEFGELTFGRLLRSHRMGEELTQVEMAKLLKISKQSLNDLESGRTIPSISRAFEIAKKIGLMEATLVELAIQDQFRHEKMNLVVKVEGRKKIKKAS